ncbi:MAG: hypothetical protein IKT65_03805 [Clostridia bacterium]|nr:hypothetical protein [Clostridia bacterium]
MVKRAVLLLVTFLLCTYGASCSADKNTSVLEAQKTEDLVFCKEESQTVALTEEYAVYFKTDSRIYSVNARLVSDNGASASISLYEWKGDYQTTMSQPAIKNASFMKLPKASEKMYFSLAFTSEVMPEGGEYLAVFSSKTGASVIAGKKTDSAANNGTVCYINGIVTENAPCAYVEYYAGD